jgi:hypothetical protein
MIQKYSLSSEITRYLLTDIKVEIRLIKIPATIKKTPKNARSFVLSNENIVKNSFSIRYISPISKIIAISAARIPW